jgi:hypothetical protein
VRPRQVAAFPSIAFEQRLPNERISTTQQSRILPLTLALRRDLDQRRCFSATALRPRDHHFDTLKFVERLKDEGLTQEQAEATMKILSDVIEERYVEWRAVI